MNGAKLVIDVTYNPRVEIARPIGTLFITPETGVQKHLRTSTIHGSDLPNYL